MAALNTPLDLEKPEIHNIEDNKLVVKPDVDGNIRVFDHDVARRAVRKIDWLLLPVLTFMYLTCSLDKSNLGNAKTLGMIKDIGKDPRGNKYALLQAMYFITYAPFGVPAALLGKRTRLEKVLCLAALFWGISASCTAAVNSFGGAYACRLLVGLGEAGFSPLVQVYLTRFYTRQAVGTRIALWLAMAPIGGFINGIIAYGVAHIHSKHLESWRILFVIEGLMTVLAGVLGLLLLPENIDSCRLLKDDEKEYLTYIRSLDFAGESHHIDWKHARGSFYRWAQILPVGMYCCQQITGQALAAYLPTLLQELGFKGANAQVATLGPYGAAAVTMVIASYLSDRYRNRGIPCQVGWVLSIIAFAIYLGVPATRHGARFAALILAECGHYITTPLILTWTANNAGNESRRAVAVPLCVGAASAIAAGSGYIFPAHDAPKYESGSAISLALSALGFVFVAIYQVLITWENRRRDKKEGKPDPGFKPDTATYADLAPGFRYFN